jgi:hypothetical protein
VPIRTQAITVTTTAQLLADATNASMTNLKTVVVQNPTGSGATIYLGGVNRAGDVPPHFGTSYTLTSSNGYALAAGQERSFDLGPGDSLYALTAAGTATGVVVMQFQAA